MSKNKKNKKYKSNLSVKKKNKIPKSNEGYKKIEKKTNKKKTNKKKTNEKKTNKKKTNKNRGNFSFKNMGLLTAAFLTNALRNPLNTGYNNMGRNLTNVSNYHVAQPLRGFRGNDNVLPIQEIEECKSNGKSNGK